MNRRQFLRAGALSLGAPLWLRALSARAAHGRAERVIFFYWPDGVAAESQEREPSLFHPAGGERDFRLPAQLEPLAGVRAHCLFFDGLTMGPTDSGSHPGGAKKLLTGVDHGNGESIDRYLARTAGAGAPHPHLYLGAMANQNQASGDKHISYVGPGQTVPPEDDPRRAFARLFGTPPPSAAPDTSVLDHALAEVRALQASLHGAEAVKLSRHLESLREVERRVRAMGGPPPSCATPRGPAIPSDLYAPESFPAILRAQVDIAIEAMACGLNRVAVIQASHHTSELIMSRFMGTPMYDPRSDMRSHQASHYGARHDPGRREFRDYVEQRRWFMGELARLIEALRARPEGEGTMLDHTLVVAMSEVSDGNTHSHDRMPFILAGGGLSTGRFLRFDHEPHANLLLSIARRMGDGIGRFGDRGDRAIL